MCFLSKTSPEVLRDSVFVYKRSPFLWGQRTDALVSKKSSLLLAARLGGAFHSATEKPGNFRAKLDLCWGCPKKRGGRKSCPIMSNHQSILVPLGLEFSRRCFIGVLLPRCFLESQQESYMYDLSGEWWFTKSIRIKVLGAF